MATTITIHQDNNPIYNIILASSMDPAFLTDFEKLGLKDHKLCIVADSNTAIHADTVKAFFAPYVQRVDVYTIAAGEENKTIQNVCGLYKFLIEAHFDRNDCLAALGGGVVGDMTGFAAATYLRGIEFIQIPTSLLAMVDSSIGGKTGVDFDGYKNMVGAFKMPKAVYINTGFLQTLPELQYFNGMAEVIKYGAILDLSFYEFLLASMAELLAHDEDAIRHMIARCCELKKQVVDEDPNEKGIRALLNFGHTAGHAIEKQKDFSLLHGQCVALGMVCAAYISFKRGLIEEEEYLELRDVLVAYRLPVTVEDLDPQTLLKVMKSDKKMNAGKLRFILLAHIGDAFIAHDVTDEELTDALRVVLYTEEEQKE